MGPEVGVRASKPGRGLGGATTGSYRGLSMEVQGELELHLPEGAYVGGCQNDGPFLAPYYNTASSI